MQINNNYSYRPSFGYLSSKYIDNEKNAIINSTASDSEKIKGYNELLGNISDANQATWHTIEKHNCDPDSLCKYLVFELDPKSGERDEVGDFYRLEEAINFCNQLEFAVAERIKGNIEKANEHANAASRLFYEVNYNAANKKYRQRLEGILSPNGIIDHEDSIIDVEA